MEVEGTRADGGGWPTGLRVVCRTTSGEFDVLE